MGQFNLFADSSTNVSLDPEWKYKDQPRKIEARHRSTTGEEYAYIFGTFQDFDVPVMFVSSADHGQLKLWWENNTELTWAESGGTEYPVRIVSDKYPLAKRTEPYHDLFEGVIKLSTF